MASVIGSSGIKNKVTTGERSISSDPMIGTRKTFQITYYVQAADVDEDTDDILAATGLPDLLALSSSAYLIRKACRETDAAALLWEVDCFYDSHISAGSGAGGSRPWNVKWSWGAETIEVVLTRDPITGKPIVNSVKEPILLTTPVSIPVLTVEKIEDSFDPDTILNFNNRVNSSTFYGAPAKCAWLSSIQDNPAEQSGVAKRRVIYVVKFNLTWDYDASAFLGWQVQPLNVGTKYLANASTPLSKATPFEDASGNPTTGNLKEDGTKVPDNQDPEFLRFNRFLTANFNLLQLGPFT